MPHLLILPYEIRAMIYAHYLAGLRLKLCYESIRRRFHPLRFGFPRSGSDQEFPYDRFPTPYDRALALTNRQLHAEIAAVEAHHTELLLVPADIRVPVAHLVPKEFLRSVRRLCIHAEYLEMPPRRKMLNSLTRVLPMLEVVRWVPKWERVDGFRLVEMGYPWPEHSRDWKEEGVRGARDFVAPGGDTGRLEGVLLRLAREIEAFVRKVHGGRFGIEIACGIMPLNGEEDEDYRKDLFMWNALIISPFGQVPDVRLRPSTDGLALLAREQAGEDFEFGRVECLCDDCRPEFVCQLGRYDSDYD